MNAARHFLIPFPPQQERAFSAEDTVYAAPCAEFVFRKAPPARFLPTSLSLKACTAAMLAAFAAGAVAAAMLVSVPQSAARVQPARAAAAATAQVELPVPIPAATAPISPATQARLRRIRFRLIESREFHSVGPLTMRLKKADAKRQTYTLTLEMKGRRVELRDRALAEPIRLQPTGAAHNEILIQKIEHDRVEGYVQVR